MYLSKCRVTHVQNTAVYLLLIYFFQFIEHVLLLIAWIAFLSFSSDPSLYITLWILIYFINTADSQVIMQEQPVNQLSPCMFKYNIKYNYTANIQYLPARGAKKIVIII